MKVTRNQLLKIINETIYAGQKQSDASLERIEDEDEYVPEYDTLEDATSAGTFHSMFPFTVYEHEDQWTGRTYFTRSDENMTPTNVKEKHYIARNPEEYSEDYMVPRDIHRLGKAADSLESTYD